MSSGYEAARLARKAVATGLRALEAIGASQAAFANKIVTPSAGLTPANISPGPGPAKSIAVMDFTPSPNGSGLVLVTYMLALSTSAGDAANSVVELIENLTAITGGTPSGVTGLTLEPTSLTGSAPILSMLDTENVAAAGNVTLQGSAVLTLTPGVRCGISIAATSTNSRAWSGLSLWCSAVELPI